MHITVPESERRITLEASIELVNALASGRDDARAILRHHGFSRADEAPKAALTRLTRRLRELTPPLYRMLPETPLEQVVASVNAELTETNIRAAVVDHDGVGFHLHWTPTTATFDDQVITDILMALAHELCDNGSSRFGSCAADGCERLFYDSTRNRSRRFCVDPRCASRTHTADHRARQHKGEASPATRE